MSLDLLVFLLLKDFILIIKNNSSLNPFLIIFQFDLSVFKIGDPLFKLSLSVCMSQSQGILVHRPIDSPILYQPYRFLLHITSEVILLLQLS